MHRLRIDYPHLCAAPLPRSSEPMTAASGLCYSKSINLSPESSMSLQEKLLRLFTLEQKVRGLQGRSNAAAARLRVQQAKLKQYNQQRVELTEQVRLVTVKASSLEGQLKDVDLRVTKLRDQMNKVTNNKEYAALLLEVNTLKADKGKVEEQALEQMAKVDALKVELGAIEAKVVEQTKLVAVAENDLKTAQEAVAGELEPALVERDAAQNDLPAPARATFNRQLEIHDGEPMAPIVEESRKHMEYSCGGCYLAIPAERVNSLMVHDKIACCTNCGRILYMEKELRASFSDD